MRIFVSWSGERSRAVAEILCHWLPRVIQAVRPYLSPDDITKGARWGSEIASALEEISVGLICLTSENLKSPWIMFEAGALSKSIQTSKVCPLLFGAAKSSLEGPLLSFRAAEFEKKEMKRVLGMINSELGESAVPQNDLDATFEVWWPSLETDVATEFGKARTTSRSQCSRRDLLEKILEQVSRRPERELK